ncbi:ArsR/SmtB family transcription factor [Paracoccus methylarcula]|uniref:ArsR family transcriptional regulator n=1 Tax=Paracoccus methylarcula TaxID=72022 RepID=A0A3R7LIX2_9RHOB|nr:metalloregulator ArsR/SmtB family transcription factor [Paracoccus methylarcula]RNF33509.1 ArsR family transcriptional regulator [Paracoccus methylarcula]
MLQNDTLFKSLGDPTRRRLFEHLCLEGEQTVRALTERAGISQPAVSKHLVVLKGAGLVAGQQRGRETLYAAQAGALRPLVEWADEMTRFWEVRFDRLDDLLKRMDQ